MQANLKVKIEESIGKILKDIQLTEQGWTSEVRQLVTTQGTYLLKSSYKERYRNWLKTEARVLVNLMDSQIPVPRYYGFIEMEESSHLIMSFGEGLTLTTALKQAQTQSERISLFRSFGEFLQQFHDRVPDVNLVHNHNWIEMQLERAQNYVNKGQAEGSQELLDTLIESKPSHIEQTMIHGDCTTDNVMVKEGKVYLFIDVSAMTVGDPRYDEALAIRKIIQEEELQSFYEGYKRYRISKEEFQYFEDGLYAFF